MGLPRVVHIYAWHGTLYTRRSRAGPIALFGNQS